MADDVEVTGTTTQSRIAGGVLTFVALMLMGLANLPYQYVESGSQWDGIMEIDDSGSAPQYQAPPRMAGWPLRYWVQYEQEYSRQDRFWSPLRLVGNLGIALCLGVIVYGYIQWRYRRIGAASNRRLTRAVFDLGIALAILLLPALVIAVEHRIAIQHRRLSSQLTRFGNTQLTVWLPEVIINHVPSGLMPSFARLRRVYLMRADQKTVQRVAEIPTLVGLYCNGGSFTSSALDPLVENNHLVGLELSRRTLSDSDVDKIASLKWLTFLKLSNTDLTSEMLSRFDEMPLRTVDLTRTPLQLSRIGKPKWSETVEELFLTRPKQGVAESLTIEGWPRLRRLSASRLTAEMNSSVFKVRLVDLPSLQTLSLDRLQKHDCVFRDLPRWSDLDEGLASLRFILRFDDMVPGLMWLSNLEVDGVASLEKIECFARDLESISVRRAPSVRRFALGSYYSSSLGDMQLQPADPDRCQKWIETVGQWDGPGKVDFTALPLANLDLSPLAKNPRIRHLRLGASGVTFGQVQQLSGMEQLESLDIGSCPLKQDQLSWMLERFPSLAHLNIDGTSLSRFDLRGSDQLKFIRMTPLQDVKEVRIVDLPGLKTYLRLLCTPQRMEIRNAPSLLGLAIESPWPENASIDGLRDLEWFAGGGEMIDDSVIDVILACDAIDQLTLAYTSVTPQKLVEIGRLDRLSLLAVPGAPVDDAITAQWHRLESLWEVNLDDTSVSVGTLAWLSKIESLRRVTLNRVRFNDVAADALSELRVSELHLAGVSLAPEKLKPLLDRGNIEALNLSGWNVDEELVNVLATASSLHHLILHDTNIDAQSLQRILTDNPLVFVDLGPNGGFLADPWEEELHRRAVRVRREFSTGWRHALPRHKTMKLIAAESEQRVTTYMDNSERAGRIDAQAFRPKPLPEVLLK